MSYNLILNTGKNKYSNSRVVGKNILNETKNHNPPFKLNGWSFSFLCCPIMCLYVLSSVLCCPLQFLHKKDDRFVFTSSSLHYLRYLYLFAHITVQHILFLVFALFIFALCTLYSSFSGLSVFHCPFGIL